MLPRQSVFLAVGLRAVIEGGGSTRFILWDVQSETEARAKRAAPVWAMLVEYTSPMNDGILERSVVITQRANELPKVKIFRTTDAAITQMVKLYDRPDIVFPLRPDPDFDYDDDQLARITEFSNSVKHQFETHLK